MKFKANFVSEKILNQENLNQVQSNNSNTNSKENNREESNEGRWYIEIEKIGLKAPIKEGTNKENLDEYVGLFEESPKEEGNICLAAHNRGYKNNYFGRIKELKEGDEIRYIYEDIERIYIVTKHEIIKNTDWSNLENTQENKITLITCVENQPEYRRCIQGIEK